MTNREFPVQVHTGQAPALAQTREIGYQPRIFTARYDGQCDGCGSEIAVGDAVFYDGGALVGDACCAGGSHLSAEAQATITNVMPRGKTAADRCPKCFIIHASGQVGCE